MPESGEDSSYLRVDHDSSKPLCETVDIPVNLLFVDVASQQVSGWQGEVAEQLRYADESMLTRRNHVLIRAPQNSVVGTAEGTTVIAEMINQRTGSKPPVGVVSFAPGEEPPPIDWLGEPASVDSNALYAAARSVELAAPLKAGKAHWKPTSLHYELPSEEHRSDFIRVGDAFRSPRDAEALATWLYPYAKTGQAVLLDSSTMLPLVMALRAACATAHIIPGPVAIRDAYPHSLLADEELVELTAGASGVLALISVSSTGRTEKALAAGLRSKVPGRWTLQSLVSRTMSPASVWPDPVQGTQGPWLHVANQASFDKHHCALCGDSRRSPRVRIDASSFANTALPEPPVLVMPDPPSAARDISGLLEMYNEIDGMGIDCDPAERTRLRRDSRRWGVIFYPHRLLKHDRLVHALNSQLRAERGDRNDGRYDLDRLYGASATHVDAIVALAGDAEHEGFDRLARWASEHFAWQQLDLTLLESDPSEWEQAKLAAELGDKQHILVLTVGTVTGGTLQEMLIRIHRALSDRSKNSYVVSGLVIHARPSSYREWQSVRSAYSHRLVAMWMTYLPTQDHPLGEEQRLFLQTLKDDLLSENAAAYVKGRRRQVLTSNYSNWTKRVVSWPADTEEPNPAAVLPCGEPQRERDQLPRLLPNSRFGHRMSMVGTLVGVGTVMHRQRLEHEAQGGPPGLRFDLSRIPTVYFEVPILAAVLRWIRPFEAFWEHPGRPVRDVLLDIWSKARFEEPGSRETLLAELGLAAAACKLPLSARETIYELFDQVAEDCSDVYRASLEVVEQLVQAAWGRQKKSR